MSDRILNAIIETVKAWKDEEDQFGRLSVDNSTINKFIQEISESVICELGKVEPMNHNLVDVQLLNEAENVVVKLQTENTELKQCIKNLALSVNALVN